MFNEEETREAHKDPNTTSQLQTKPTYVGRGKLKLPSTSSIVTLFQLQKFRQVAIRLQVKELTAMGIY